MALNIIASIALGAQPTLPPPLFEGHARADRIGRILVPVHVNERGPYYFVLDTGANRTVLTPRLAASLGLEIATDDNVTMNGVTGSASVHTVMVDRIAAGDVILEKQRLPVADSLSSDTDGILGVDALGDTRVFVNFSTGKVQIRPSHHEPLMNDFMRIPGQCRLGSLLMIKGSVGRVPVSAVIDTGSEYTLANAALRAKLGFSPQIAASNTIDVIGETLTLQRGERRPVPLIRMGGVQIVSPTVIFGDFHVFKLWKLEAHPAIVLGMDMIGTLDALLIDYRRCELQIRTRRNLFSPTVPVN